MRGVITAALLLGAAASASCGSDVSGSGGPGVQRAVEVLPYTSGGRIAWDYRTLRRPFEGPASYPRMIRLANGDLLLSVESRGASYVLWSSNHGASWSAPIEVASPRDGVIAAVPSLLQLESGTVLLAYNPRPPMDNTDPARRFGIEVAASADRGRSWQKRATVFQAGARSTEGIWEPAMIQLATGEILLFVANEFPYGHNDDQEISLFRSADEGRTWSAPETVSYRQGHRDGMPAPLILSNGGGIAIGIEDDGLVPGPFKPVIVWMPASGKLGGAVVGGESERRWAALGERDRLPVAAYGGAPHLVQLPDGETLLSFQSNEGRRGDWATSTMVVAIGDAQARSFSRKSHPFRVPEGERALWGSLFVKDERTVTALTTTTAYNSAQAQLYVIDGHRIAEPRADSGSVGVDGAGTEAVWDGGTEIFLGAYSTKVASIRTAWDHEAFYAFADVVEGNVVETPGASETDDAVLVYLAPRSIAQDAPVSGAFRLRVEADGALRLDEGDRTTWRPVDASGVVAAVSPKRADTSFAPTGIRYGVEIAVPWARLGGLPPTGTGWGLSFGLVNNDGSGQIDRETVAGTDAERPSTWLRIEMRR